MITFKIVRKIGKMLRGGAGRKEIFLGALCGVLIGFNPVAGATLGLMILITLLLNANIGFALLGVAVGKILSLILSVASFHIGFFIIHNMGLEGLFSKLANAPFAALMDLDVYAMIGSLPFSIIVGLLFGKFISGTVTRIREQMVKAAEHEKVGKAVGNKFSRFLMWLAFGKQKISTSDVLAKESPLLRKAGLILVGSVVVIGLLLQFLLLDMALKKGLQSSISGKTGAEVNIGKANLSLAGGKLEIEGLQVTDPDKLTHNMVQIEKLAADISVSDLLRRTYTIDLLSGSVLTRDVERATPGKLLVKEDKDEKTDAEKDAEKKDDGGKSLDEYFAKAGEWKVYGEKIYEYLKERKDNAETVAKGEKPKASKEKAVADAKRLGYLKARADLVSDRPEWTIRSLEIDNVKLSSDYPVQNFQGSELSSHPELNGLPTTLVMTPQGAMEPAAKITLRFDDSTAAHRIFANLKEVDLGKAIKSGDKLKVEEGKADIKADGSFSTDALEVPFTLTVRELKTNNDIINNLKNLEVPGKLYGSLTSPRIKVELDDNLKDAAIDAAKEKAKEEAKKEAEKQLNKALESDEAKELKEKASKSLKKFF
ncbi:DUF2062 domain-containing protein [Pontiellaceae bacterium B12227]|nr:DUF2062 domain-containing protein [Pontiellaceae bacterium B12227]